MKQTLIKRFYEVQKDLEHMQLIQEELSLQKDKLLNEILGHNILSRLPTRVKRVFHSIGIDTDAKLIRFLAGDNTAFDENACIYDIYYRKSSTPYERLLSVKSFSYKTANQVLDTVSAVMTAEEEKVLGNVNLKLESVNSEIEDLSNEKRKLYFELDAFDTRVIHSLPNRACKTLYFIGINKDCLFICFLNGSRCFNAKHGKVNLKAFMQANTPYERLLTLSGVGPATANKCLQIVKKSEYASFVRQ